jgi:hypothetical protein
MKTLVCRLVFVLGPLLTSGALVRDGEIEVVAP